MNKYLYIGNYIRKIVSIILSISSPLIRFWERIYLNKYGRMPLKHQPVFIIGAPRTGSTILYQALTNSFDVLYFDNLVCKFYANPFWGCLLSHLLFANKCHSNFHANHGNTSKFGWHAPSECGAFWYRWLPKDRHFIDDVDISGKMIHEIHQEISALINYYDKPIVFKNLNAGQRLRLLVSAQQTPSSQAGNSLA